MYEKYAILESQIKELTLLKEKLREEISADMFNKGEKKIETSVGVFSISKLKTWTYPEKVLKIEEEFKAAKEKAKSTGEATFIEEDSLRFTSIKL